MTDDDDWGVPAKPVATGAGRGRGFVKPAPAAAPGNANDSWALPGAKSAEPQGANSSWDTSVYQGQPKPAPTPSTPVADHSWDNPAPTAGGRGVTAAMGAMKVNDDDWGVPKSVPAGESY